MNSVLVDTSFCIRLLKSNDPFHENVKNWFEYFLNQKIDIYLSTIAISEYSVKDDPINLLALQTFKILEFDFEDARTSGKFTNLILQNSEIREIEKRSVVINDIKLIAQVHNREIDAYISKDRKSFSKIIENLKKETDLNFIFIDLTVPKNEFLGELDF